MIYFQQISVFLNASKTLQVCGEENHEIKNRGLHKVHFLSVEKTSCCTAPDDEGYATVRYCTMYNVQCTLYNVQCTVYNVRCTMYNVQCTLYSIHKILIY